jgi:hypothetical protein
MTIGAAARFQGTGLDPQPEAGAGADRRPCFVPAEAGCTRPGIGFFSPMAEKTNSSGRFRSIMTLRQR